MAKTLDQGFETFLGWLIPLTSEHDKVKSHKDSVKACLEKNFECYDFFETGSFGNSTGVRHYSDTDYFAVIPSKKLHEDSSYSLRKVKEALQETFWRTEGIVVNTPAVNIPFGTYASETLEVTPCTFNGLVDTPVGSKGSYDIPNYEGGWMKSSPRAHNAYVKREDERLGYKLKPLIRLIKAWKFYNNVPISSFYLELRTTKYAEGESSIVYDIDVKSVLKMLYERELPSIQDPMGISGYVKACSTDAKREIALSKVKTGYTRTEKAVEKRESNVDDAFYWWNLFYNDKFPNR
ncbi:nucleotidyltransferase [Paraflavitalea sp. CAU 1676]|uniref:nucleotidyltransferase domain-containing protein n=1 Tax=Paraflavitalea sp. CAU 1676 TaxID=3032598 RepID=UPI0023DB8BDE|nr:nucleotidyltransferase [Paraflavitalea sp. CAU 1676]MDF2192610.1 nucleotidyltransferase [Paraflavitalea sp. CAU 1676]